MDTLGTSAPAGGGTASVVVGDVGARSDDPVHAATSTAQAATIPTVRRIAVTGR